MPECAQYTLKAMIGCTTCALLQHLQKNTTNTTYTTMRVIQLHQSMHYLQVRVVILYVTLPIAQWRVPGALNTPHPSLLLTYMAAESMFAWSEVMIQTPPCITV